MEKPPVATPGAAPLQGASLVVVKDDGRRSRPLPPSSTKRPDKHRVAPAGGTSRPFRAAQYAGGNRVCQRSSSVLSCRRANSQTSQLALDAPGGVLLSGFGYSVVQVWLHRQKFCLIASKVILQFSYLITNTADTPPPTQLSTAQSAELRLDRQGGDGWSMYPIW